MATQFSLAEILFLIVILQLLGMSFFLFTAGKGKRVSNTLLGLYFFVLALNLLDQFLFFRKIYFSFPAFAFWSSAFPFLFGPLLYFYVQSVLFRNFTFDRTKWIHFAPFFVLGILFEAFYIPRSEASQVKVLTSIFDRNVPWHFHLGSAIALIQFSCYIFLSMRLIRQHQKEMAQAFSDHRRQNVSWLTYTLLFFTALMLVSTVNGFMALTIFAEYYFIILMVILLALMVYVTQILYKALLSLERYRSQLEPVSNTPGINLSETEINDTINRIRQFMDVKKPFHNPELTLDELANQLEFKPKVLSIILNEYMNQNFFDFVNRYRIDEAKNLLLQAQNAKVLGVLMDAGFNSKSSFNALFKKYTGLTPSEFRKKHA